MFVFRMILEILDVLLTVVGSIFLLNFPQNVLRKVFFFPFSKLGIKYFSFFEFLGILRQQYAYSFEVAVSSDQKWLEV